MKDKPASPFFVLGLALFASVATSSAPAAPDAPDASLFRDNPEDGFFSLTIDPSKVSEGRAKRELVILIDRHTFSTAERGKDLIHKVLGDLREGETFNLMTVSGDAVSCFDEPQPKTPVNLHKAMEFNDGIDSQITRTHGKKLELNTLGILSKELSRPADPDRQRVYLLVVLGKFMGGTAPQKGIDFVPEPKLKREMLEMLEEKMGPSLIFVGSMSVKGTEDTQMLNKVAAIGSGEIIYITRTWPETEFTPNLALVDSIAVTGCGIDFRDLPVGQILPPLPSVLIHGKPVTVYGRHAAGAKGDVLLRGRCNEEVIEHGILLDPPSPAPAGVQNKWLQLVSARWYDQHGADSLRELEAAKEKMSPRLADAISQHVEDLITGRLGYFAGIHDRMPEGWHDKTVQPDKNVTEIVKGVAEVMIHFDGLPDKPTIEKMEKLGFVTVSDFSFINTLSGKIHIDKLRELVLLPKVTHLEPNVLMTLDAEPDLGALGTVEGAFD